MNIFDPRQKWTAEERVRKHWRECFTKSLPNTFSSKTECILGIVHIISGEYGRDSDESLPMPNSSKWERNKRGALTSILEQLEHNNTDGRIIVVFSKHQHQE